MDHPQSRGLFLGVDGGGTKTEFVLIDRDGQVLARYRAGTSYYLQIGFDGLNRVLSDGVHAVLTQAGVTAADIIYAFFGLPAHGEDSQAQGLLDVMPEAVLGHRRYQCGNDMVCGWAGSLGGADGINIVAGTGSIGYGERLGVKARGGGWGEIFSDEGSAYWIAIQGLNAFTRMSDGRMARGPLHGLLRAHFDVEADIDICGRLMGVEPSSRDQIAALARLVAQAALTGDHEAVRIFERAAFELAAIIDAIRRRLGFTPGETVKLSYSGGVFRGGDLVLGPLKACLATLSPDYALVAPMLSPSLGSALYAARLAGEPLGPPAVRRLATFG
jgi:N-acetylglucosamine kinase-like BadF-type ATPase